MRIFTSVKMLVLVAGLLLVSHTVYAGNGTKEAPYTVAELNAQKDALVASGNTVWVKADLKGLGEDGSQSSNTDNQMAALFGDGTGTFVAYSYQILKGLSLSDLTNTKDLLISVNYGTVGHPNGNSANPQYATDYEKDVVTENHFSLGEVHGALQVTVSNGMRGFHFPAAYVVPKDVVATRVNFNYNGNTGASINYGYYDGAEQNYVVTKNQALIFLANDGTYDVALSAGYYEQINSNGLNGGTQAGVNAGTTEDRWRFRFVSDGTKRGFERNSDDNCTVILESKDEVYLQVNSRENHFGGNYAWETDDRKWITWAGKTIADFENHTPTPSDALTALWGKSVQGTIGSAVTSQGADIQMAPDGGIYISGGAGTKTVEDIIRFGNDQIAAPATPYLGNGNTGTQNLFVSKVSAEGVPLWTVYSKNGQVQSSSAKLQSVSDGLLVAFGIQHPTKMLTSTVTLVDAKGQETDLQWTLSDADKNYYRLYVMKLSHEGALQWLRQVEVDHANTADGFSLNGMKTDSQGHIFIVGQLKANMTWPKADGSQAVLEASESAADFLFVKLDQNGYYQDRLTATGSLASANVRTLHCHGGKLYLMATAKRQTETAGAFTLGSQSLTLSNDYETLLMGSVNSDLTVNWVRQYESGANFNMQQSALHVNDQHIYLAGMGAISVVTNAGKTIQIGEDMNRQATLLQFDVTTGSMTDGYLKPLFQSGYFALFEDVDGNVYAAGYPGIFSGKRAVAGGLFIDTFLSSDLTAPVSSWENVIQNVGGPQGIAYTADGRLYTMTRSTSNANALMGTEMTITQDLESYCCNVCAFQLPVSPVTAIKEVSSSHQTATDGYWYNLQGQRVDHPAKGVYIHNGRKIVMK